MTIIINELYMDGRGTGHVWILIYWKEYSTLLPGEEERKPQQQQ